MTKYDDYIARIRSLKGLASNGWFEIIGDLDPRSSAIVATSILEDFLTAAIIAKFRDSFDEYESLFEGYSPIATLSSKISVGRALDILTKDMQHDLKIIKTVRNSFAHSYAKVSFDKDPTRASCNTLRIHKNFKTGELPHITSKNQRRFLECAMQITLQLAISGAKSKIEKSQLAARKEEIEALLKLILPTGASASVQTSH
jgi:hypothetical protein